MTMIAMVIIKLTYYQKNLDKREVVTHEKKCLILFISIKTQIIIIKLPTPTYLNFFEDKFIFR